MLFNDLFSYTIVLNSRSPRRKQLLEQMGFNVRLVKTDISETYPPNLNMEEIPVYLAEKKANAYKKMLGEKEILLCSDTIVFIDGKVLGKPQNKEQAIDMLKNLSNKKHYVISGCYLKSKTNAISFYEKTAVFFKNLSLQDIDYYVENYKPMDKAGSYGIQEWIGMIGIEKIEGNFYNVMGLPTVSLFENIQKLIK